MVDLFRHCPGCGRRFHIKLVEKDDLGSQDTESAGPITGHLTRVGSGRVGAVNVATVQEGPTMYHDIREFAYRYKCGHCGHEWTETRLEDKPVEVDMDPIND